MPMHELAICQSVVDQVSEIAASHGGRVVGRIGLSIGPLAGVEPALLRAAFPLVAVGTLCESAVIDIADASVRVHCPLCDATSGARPNQSLIMCKLRRLARHAGERRRHAVDRGRVPCGSGQGSVDQPGKRSDQCVTHVAA